MQNQNTRRSNTQSLFPKGFTRPSSSRNVSVRDIMLCFFRPILRATTLRNDEAGKNTLFYLPTHYTISKKKNKWDVWVQTHLRLRLRRALTFLDYDKIIIYYGDFL